VRPHDTDFVSLVFGLVFVAVGVLTLLDATGVVHLHVSAGWLVTATLIGLGLAGIAGTLNRRRRISRAAVAPDEVSTE